MWSKVALEKLKLKYKSCIGGMPMLKVGFSSSERWIFISGEFSFDNSDEFIDLVKGYQAQLSGEIKATSNDTRYVINNDPLKLIFQWDSCFGITVIAPDETDISEAQKTLIELCDELNLKANKQKIAANN